MKKEEPEMQEPVFDMPNDVEAIEAAYNAYMMADSIDKKLQDKETEQRLEEIKQDAIFIVWRAMSYLKEPYLEKDDKED